MDYKLHSTTAAKRHPQLMWMLASFVFFVLAIGVFSPESAFAYDPEFEIYEPGASSVSGPTDLGNEAATFTCSGGTPSGDLFINPQCNATGGISGIFANIICRLENLFGNILALIYCSVQDAILEPLLALMILSVTLYGAMVVLGMVPHTFTKAFDMVLRIGLVAAIALNAEIGIQIAYKFYINLLQSTVAIIFDAFNSPPAGIYEHVRGGYMLSPIASDDNWRLSTGEHWMQNIDSTVNKIVGIFVDGGVGFIVVLVLLFIFLPPLFFLVLYLFFSIFKLFVTAIIGYLLGLLGITFLFTVAPIFVSFALFRFTYGWFLTWLKYLASFSLQIMIIFAFLMMAMMIDFVAFLQNVGTLVRSYVYTIKFGWAYTIRPIYSLCDVERDGAGEIIYYSFRVTGPQEVTIGDHTYLDATGNLVADGPYNGFPKCREPFTIQGILDGSNMPPGMTEDQRDDIIDAFNDDPDILGEDVDVDGIGSLQSIIDKNNEDLTLKLFELIGQPDLIFFIVIRFIAVIVLTYMLERFMTRVAMLATHLAGTGFSGRLGGGEVDDDKDSVGLQDSTDFMGLETGMASARQAAKGHGAMHPIKNLRSAPDRFLAGVRAGVKGTRTGMRKKTLRHARAMGGRSNAEASQDLSLRQATLQGEFRSALDPRGVGTKRPKTKSGT